MSTKKDKLHETLVADIQSGEEQRILDGLSKIKSEGTTKILPNLFTLWFDSKGEINAKITEILYSLKETASITVIFDALEKERKSENRQQLLSIFWNAGLEPKNHLSKLVSYAIDGEFMETFECLTVIENTEPPFPEDQIMESIMLMKEYFGKNSSGEKYDLMRSIATIIQYTDDTQVDL